MAHRPSMRRTAEDWQDLYDGLNERHRQLQQRLNEREEELKLLRVSQRRATAETARAARAPRSPPNMRQPRGRGQGQGQGQVQVQKQEEVGPGHEQKEEEEEREGSVQRQDKGRQTFLTPVSSAWAPAAPPDPSMVWGMEHSVQNYVTANALYHANEELRQRLDDAAGFVATLQRELAESRALVTGTQARLEDAAQQIRELVRERDVACQKLSTAQRKIEDLERALQTRAMDEERVRFSLETQITELRGRLVIGADSNEQLTRDVRTLLSEVKEKSSLAQSLQSRLALAESALATQRQNNENILVELHSLNRQLVNERKRLLSITREAQLAGLRGADVQDLKARLAESRNAHNTLEREHVRLMGSLVHLTEGALRQAREEVRNDLTDARGAAAHWEETAQLLYRDAAQRTKSHVQCREECEEAKRARDEAEVALRAAHAELRVCRTKLDMVWPTHVADTEGLSGEELRNAFTRPIWTRRRTRVRAHSATNANGTAGSDATDHMHNDDGDDDNDNDNDGDLLSDPTAAALHLSGDVSLEEQVRELHEANTALVAEITQLRATVELQRMRLRASDGNARAAREAGDAIRTSCEHREAAAHAMVRAKMDRVEFLEAQVRSLRGYDVAPNHSLGDVAPGETVFELFLGQIISTETPQGTALRNTFPPVFCSADFLLHETTTTPIVTGLNAFLDTTVAFCVAMDALLLCYLQSRELLVQLHRVRPQDEITGVSPYPHRNPSAHSVHSPHPMEGEEPRQLRLTNMGAHNDGGAVGGDDVLFAERLFETIAEGSVSLWALVQDDAQLRAPRPTLRGHIPLRTPSGHHIASVEFSVTVRVAFSDAFRSMATDAARNWAPPPPPPPPPAQQQQQQLQQQQQQLQQQQEQLSSHVPFTPPPVFASTVPSPSPSPSPLSMSVPLHPPTDVRSASLSGLPRSAPLRLVPAAADFASTTSSSVSLRGTPPHSAPGAFTHVPIAAASAASSIRALRVDVSRLRLAPGAARLPRLMCYYALAALGRDVRLPAPPTPRCECEYLQEGGAHGTRFVISSARELLAATREPLVLFFVDEDAGRGGQGIANNNNNNNNNNNSATGSGDAYWAIAMADWRAALERPGEYAVLDLPLVSPQGTRVDGAEVRVRLLAERVAVSSGPSQATHEVERVTPQRQSAPVDQSLDVEMLRRQLGE